MRIKTIQKESGTYMRVPDELRKAEELELFALREGYYLLSVPLGGKTAPGAGDRMPGAKYAPETKATVPAPGGLSQQESRVLMKLADIRFEKRVPEFVNKDFSRQDREALMSLEKKGAVTLIKSKKYPEGVYSIQNEFYPQPQKREEEAKPADTDLEKQLFRDGYIVVADSNAAQRLSDVLQKQRGAISGVKGFDGKYYMVTKAFAGRVKAALVKMGGDYADPKEVGVKEGLHPDGVKAVLKILAESGEYMEKGEIFIKVE